VSTAGMGRPTIADQIAKAAAEGNLEKVKELAGKLKAPSKPKKKVVKPKDKKIIEVYEDEVNEPKINKNAVGVGKDTSSFIATARNPNKQRKVIDEDGQEKIVSKVVPFKIIKNRKNSWKDDQKIEKEDIDEYKKVKKKGYKPVKRDRDSVNKIKVKCSRCKDIKIVWPGEVTHKNWACDECLTSGRERGD
jgi:hypothetical protein